MKNVKIVGLVGLTIALLLVPTSVGILLVRRPAEKLPTVTATPVHENTTHQGALIREEVVNSVLSKPTAIAAKIPTPRILILRNGEQIGIGNGESVRLTDDLQVAVSIDPYPPGTLSATLDLYLTTANGKPVTDAAINLQYDMFMMEHGASQAAVDNIGDGHYVVPVQFSMFGSWMLEITVSVAGQDDLLSMPIVVNVWPTE